jgi:Fe-S-cluster-containing hydrogenase component 2
MTQNKETITMGLRRIAHDPKPCTGCGLCDLMCSLYHEGEQGTALSRAELTGDRLYGEFTFHVCQQCSPAPCYEACPNQDEALYQDGATGITLINPAGCDGCGICIDACTFDPPRIKMHPDKEIAFKCDLCRGREGGPICIEYCGFDALKTAPAEEGMKK